jgi:hypothetical protein
LSWLSPESVKKTEEKKFLRNCRDGRDAKAGTTKELPMKSVHAQVHAIQAHIDRGQACAREIAELEQKRGAAAELVNEGKRQLILSLAEESGVMALGPEQIVAVFANMRVSVESTRTPEAITGEGTLQPGARLAPDVDLEEGAEADVSIKFGNHRSTRVALLRETGLKWNGRLGLWQGRVDREELARLQSTVPGKVSIRAIHHKPAAEAVVAGVENVDKLEPATEEWSGPTENAENTVSTQPSPTATGSAPDPSRELSSATAEACEEKALGVVRDLPNDASKSASFPRSPFTGLRRPFVPKYVSGPDVGGA